MCWNSQAACESGSNACGVGFPCTQEYSVCATGAASSDGNYSWFCLKDAPIGALPTGSGLLWRGRRNTPPRPPFPPHCDACSRARRR